MGLNRAVLDGIARQKGERLFPEAAGFGEVATHGRLLRLRGEGFEFLGVGEVVTRRAA